MDKILDAAFSIVTGLAQGLLNALPKLVAALPQIISSDVYKRQVVGYIHPPATILFPNSVKKSPVFVAIRCVFSVAGFTVLNRKNFPSFPARVDAVVPDQPLMVKFLAWPDESCRVGVMITHNNEIAQLADRIVRIEDGKIVG